MKSRIISLIAIFIALIISCNDNDDYNKFSIEGISQENYPKIDGSTSTEPLHSLIACKLFDMPYAWIYDKFNWEYPYHLYPSAGEDHNLASFIMQKTNHTNTHQAFVNLIDKYSDLILVARTASYDEKHMADSLDVTLIETPIALDALIFLVNDDNPISGVTTKQIQDVYTLKISNWNELGGSDSKINAYTREKNSGSQELMESLMMKDLEMPDLPDMMILGMLGLINRIEFDELGFGYSVNYYTKYMIRSDSIKLLSVDGVYPDFINIRNRNYGYTAEVYAVIRKDLDKNSYAYKLYELLQTGAGQNVIGESGYVPYY